MEWGTDRVPGIERKRKMGIAQNVWHREGGEGDDNEWGTLVWGLERMEGCREPLVWATCLNYRSIKVCEPLFLKYLGQIPFLL